ncbi:hypothetical protein X975_00054, partial [Stegodyphus mimosarum]
MMIPEGAYESQEVIRHQDQLETSSSQLDIPLESSSLPDGILRLACEASISNFVTSISKELLISREHNDQPPQSHIDPQDNGTQNTHFESLLYIGCIVWLGLLRKF